jgi:sec-independent protein translocase protein TatA
MFPGFSFPTLIIILIIALLLFGPRRLPELGESIAKTIRSFKKAHDEPDSASTRTEIPPSATATPQAATCPQCHKEVGGDFAFCPHCGGKMNQA